MFGGKKSLKPSVPSDVNTLIGEGCVFEGNLNLSTATRIDGKVKGNIRSEEMLIIGENGSVEGDITCSEVLIYGTVIGNIEARRVEVKKGAYLNGDVKVDVFVVEEGATYNGRCSMGETQMPEPSAVEVKE
ncbi:MAG: polymer-forming cytoskeletal protein [Aquificota bacterium]|nr:polymer-forming cytoskeletal protein [Aquificota bacterium]